MKTVKGIKAAALLAATVLGAPAFAEPITRTAEAEIIAGYDFTLWQQQGDDFVLRYDDSGANFESRRDNPAAFSFTIETTADTLSACTLHFITRQKPASAARRGAHNSGAQRLDASYRPGLAGYVTGDKTAVTGGGGFSFSVSQMEAGGAGTIPAAMAQEIVTLPRVSLSPLAFPAPLRDPVSGTPNYDFTASFNANAPRGQIKWLGVSDNWGTPEFNVYALPCAAVVSADKSSVSPKTGSNFPLWPIVAGAVLLLGGLGALLDKARKRGGKGGRSTRHAPKAKPRRPEQSGVVFAGSPMVAGAVAPGAAPLAPAVTMVSSGLQTLTGAYAALKPAYRATGRIGGPQEGVPTNDDVAFGTGFLVTPNHVMTNQHVWEFYKHYLAGEDCGGIEFIAERDRDASDYVAFNGEPPVIIKDLDIAIFTLARPVTDRMPIDRIAAPAQSLDGREVVTVSYPCPFETDETILAVVEPHPIFAVKRLSEGKIFRHSTDTDAPYGVDVPVDPAINPDKAIAAICHNASTLGGSSGAPILDRQGRLVGVHFAGKRSFNEAEAANLAMAIDRIAAIDLKSKQT